MRTLILNDLHFGVKRQAGTTKESRDQLEDYMFEALVNCLRIPHDRLIIAGDLYDKRIVEPHIIKEVVNTIKHEENCYIMLGNHDLGGVHDEKSMSSAELTAIFAGATVVKEPTRLDDIYMLPHLIDQAAHEAAVKEVPDGVALITHCNIDNPFATGDHSLNLSKEEIDTLNEKRVKVLAAHEHQHRQYKNVTVMGNQYPTSIADCLGNDHKIAVVIDSDEGQFDHIKVWDQEVGYQEMHYDEIVSSHKKFIRIVGDCPAAEGVEVGRKIIAYRKDSDALIVGVGIKILRNEYPAYDKEVVDKFNIMELLLGQIDKKFKEDVSTCI